MRLSLDQWEGARVSFAETEEPSVEQVLDAVDKLDSGVHTEVSLNRDDPFEYLTIAGGPEYFLVSGEARDEALVQLTNPDADEGKVTLVCGGQSNEFNLRDVVPRSEIEAAVRQFFSGLSEELPSPWSVE